MTQNLQDATKTVLKGKFRAMEPISRNEKKSSRQSNLTPKTTRKRKKGKKNQLVEEKKS